MSGLVYKNLRGGGISPMWISIFLAICIAAGIATRLKDMFTLVISAVCGGFIGAYILQFYTSADILWRKREATMPLKAAQVELSRYLAHIIVYAISLVGITLYSVANYVSGVWVGEYHFFVTVINAAATWSCLFLLLGAFFFVVLRIMNTTATVIIGKIAGFAVTIAIVAVSASVTRAIAESWFIAVVPVSMSVFGGSYFFNLWLYKRRLRKRGV